MSRQLADWSNDASAHPSLVWWNRMDHRYQIEVQRTGNYTANLLVFDHEDNDRELLCESIQLSYGAIFGPDADDTSAWQKRVAEFVDAL